MSAPQPTQPADPAPGDAGPPRHGRSVPAIAGIGAIATLALVVGLFGGGMAVASAATSPANALKAYQKCLANHGVKNLPRGAGGFGRGAGGTRPPTSSAPTNSTAPTPPRTAPKLTSKQKKAMKACQSKLPKRGTGAPGGAAPGGGPGGGPGGAAFQQYTTCLTQHGVTIPANGGFRSINPNDPTVQAAMTACASVRPNFGGGQGRGGGQPPTTTAAANA
ncbi:MAG: hypothetical protein JWL73_311 [Actinomycetia bacterium]|nr:hypothetical protein [Actinomycetes bacterium]